MGQNKPIVGILTLTQRGNDNYGAYLQAWALKEVIQRETCLLTCVLALEKPLGKWEIVPNTILGKIERKIALWNRKRKEIRKKGFYSDLTVRFNKFADFLDDFCLEGKGRFCVEEFAEASEHIRCFVIGSDWVWHLSREFLNDSVDELRKKNCLAPYFFGFWSLRPVQKRITYAASQGIVPDIPSLLLKSAINNFDAIGLREKESVDYLREVCNISKPLFHTVDPTLLLNRDLLLKLEVSVEIQKPYLLIYCLPFQFNQAFDEYVRKIQNRTGYAVVILNRKDHYRYTGNGKVYEVGDFSGPREFLSYVKGADYVITNSFHGQVFAALYHRPFTGVQRAPGDFRQSNMVKMLGLQDRLLDFSSDRDDGKDPFDSSINWKDVDLNREKAIESSLQYLRSNLKLEEYDGNSSY